MVEEMKGTLLFTLIMATSYWELLHDGAFSTYEAIEGQPPHYHVGTWIVSNCRTCHANLQELVGPYQHCLELHSMSPTLWRVNIFSRNSGAVCKRLLRLFQGHLPLLWCIHPPLLVESKCICPTG